MKNRLEKASSLYLRQHAGNPVHWQPWGQEALDEARAGNKLLLVSIGYAACHWCHVMEHEAFSNSEVAALMNKHFVCIKVDREEHPDIDQQYMTAVTLLTGRGGWPLNCFALPDGRPVYGGTYFRRDDWMHVLERLSYLWHTRPEDLVESAVSITEGVSGHDHIGYDRADRELTADWFVSAAETLEQSMDKEHGGTAGAPKFPMPPLIFAMLSIAGKGLHSEVGTLATFTLKQMQKGGIHDHLGGGFARYSVDHAWRIPHFEKMLYDNAQLLTCYASAYRSTRDPVFRETAYGILFFLNTLMRHSAGGYYGSMDADSEGEEGRFYTWTQAEIESVLGDDAQKFLHHYSCTPEGNFEEGRNILYLNLKDSDSGDIAALERFRAGRKALFLHRSGRVHPATDTKLIASWNCMLVSALVEAHLAFDDADLLEAARNLMLVITDNALRADGRLKHLFGANDAPIDGVLEDYGAAILALVDLYQVTFDKSYTALAAKLMLYVLADFQEPKSGMFYFVSEKQYAPVARKMELYDHVTPSSNAMVALGLYRLSFLLDKPEWLLHSERMAGNMKGRVTSAPTSHGTWLSLMLEMIAPGWQVTLSGAGALAAAKEITKRSGANVLVRLSGDENQTPDEPLQLVACRDKTCFPPFTTLEELFEMMEDQRMP
jgi:uncharacterized protein